MKVILLRDVAKIGRRHEVKEVPDGYALNMLIPRKLAEIATSESLRRLEELKSKQAAGAAQKGANFKDILLRLTENPPEISVEANEKGHLFKGVRAEDIATYLKDLGCDIEAQNIKLDAPLKELGTHSVILQHKENKGAVTITLTART